jgi:hypothetical protein
LSSGGYRGHSFTLGKGLGLLPISLTSYKSNTTVSPLNKNAKIKINNDLINKAISELDSYLKQVDQDIQYYSSGIQKNFDAIEQIDKQISQYKESGAEFSEYSNLIIDRKMYMDAAKSNQEKVDELNKYSQSTRGIIGELEKQKED